MPPDEGVSAIGGKDAAMSETTREQKSVKRIFNLTNLYHLLFFARWANAALDAPTNWVSD